MRNGYTLVTDRVVDLKGGGNHKEDTPVDGREPSKVGFRKDRDITGR